MNDLMPEEMPGQVNLADLPRDSRFKHDGCLRYSEPDLLVTDTIAWLNGLKIPRRSQSILFILHFNEIDFVYDVLQAVQDEEKLSGVSMALPFVLPLAFSSHAQNGKIYFSPKLRMLLSSSLIEERAFAWRVIAHEYWHAIRVSPMQANPSSGLEEGLAQEFSERMSRAKIGGVAQSLSYQAELLQLRNLMQAWGTNQNRVWRDLLMSRKTKDLATWLWDETKKRGFSSLQAQKLLGYRR